MVISCHIQTLQMGFFLEPTNDLYCRSIPLASQEMVEVGACTVGIQALNKITNHEKSAWCSYHPTDMSGCFPKAMAGVNLHPSPILCGRRGKEDVGRDEPRHRLSCHLQDAHAIGRVAHVRLTRGILGGLGVDGGWWGLMGVDGGWWGLGNNGKKSTGSSFPPLKLDVLLSFPLRMSIHFQAKRPFCRAPNLWVSKYVWNPQQTSNYNTRPVTRPCLDTHHEVEADKHQGACQRALGSSATEEDGAQIMGRSTFTTSKKDGPLKECG